MKWIVSLRWSLLIYMYSEPPHCIRAKSGELARAQVRVRFDTCRCALVRRGLLKKLHSGCDLEYIVVSSGQRDIFSRNGNVAK